MGGLTHDGNASLTDTPIDPELRFREAAKQSQYKQTNKGSQ